MKQEQYIAVEDLTMAKELSIRELSFLAFIAQYAAVARELEVKKKNPFVLNELVDTFDKARRGHENWLSPLAIHTAAKLLGKDVPKDTADVPFSEVEELVAKLKQWQTNNEKMDEVRMSRRSSESDMGREYSLGIPGILVANTGR